MNCDETLMFRFADAIAVAGAACLRWIAPAKQKCTSFVRKDTIESIS
jgi:hypothetical protein